MNQNRTTEPGYALHRPVLPCVIVILLFLTAGCRGSENNAEMLTDFPCTGGGITIQWPSSTGTYTTATTPISLAGMVNANYPNVVWSNSVTTDFGTAVLSNYRLTCIPPFGCFYIYDWYAAIPISLAMGTT